MILLVGGNRMVPGPSSTRARCGAVNQARGHVRQPVRQGRGLLSALTRCHPRFLGVCLRACNLSRAFSPWSHRDSDGSPLQRAGAGSPVSIIVMGAVTRPWPGFRNWPSETVRRGPRPRDHARDHAADSQQISTDDVDIWPSGHGPDSGLQAKAGLA